MSRLDAWTCRFEPCQSMVCCSRILSAIVLIALASCAAPPDQTPTAGVTRPAATLDRDPSVPAVVTRDPVASPRYPLVQKIEHMGVSVEMSLSSHSDRDDSEEIQVGDDLQVQFRIVDETTHSPLAQLNPAAWIDRRDATRGETCDQLVKSFLTGSLSARAEYDLNAFYVLALNDEPTITVVDPLFSYGGTRLLAMVRLPSRGEDWVLSDDLRRLFVTMPLINQVAVVDVATWEVVGRVDVGVQPMRIRLQPDGRYLWVSCLTRSSKGQEGLTTVVDTVDLTVAASIPTGDGHHDYAFSSDSSRAFVSNPSTGSVSVIDVATLKETSAVRMRRGLGGIAYSSVSRSAYAVDPVAGDIVVIDGATAEVTQRIPAKPGLGTIRVSPDERHLFVANTKEHTIDIIDVATNEILHTVDVGPEPDQIVFTLNMAYVRSRGSEIILMIPLDRIGMDGPMGVVDFTGGQTPFGVSENSSLADGIATAPSGLATVVANPVDKTIYYYREGMAAPMGEFSNYGREPRAVMVIDRSLNEPTPGTYSTTIKMDRPGDYDVAFLLDVPRIVHCFTLHVAPRPGAPVEVIEKPYVIEVEIEGKQRRVAVGEPIQLRYTIRDVRTGLPLEGDRDFGVLTVSTGNWQNRQWADRVSEGVYVATFVPPTEGVFYTYCTVPSLSIQYRDFPSVVLTAVARD